MPTYDDLRNYFQESGQLQAIAKAASAVPIVTGFTLDVDPFWAFLYDIENDLATWPSEVDMPRNWHERLEVLDKLFYWGRLYGNLFALQLGTRYQGYRRRDLYKKVKMWERLESRYRPPRLLPVKMTIVHRPLQPTLNPGKEEADDQEQLRRLVVLVRESPVSALVEERPLARLALASGDGIQVGNGKSGTLGGVLDDVVNSKSYGVTCAHVAVAGDAISDASGNPIGTCNADTTRVALPRGTVCDPVNLTVPHPVPGNGPDLNMLDCALFELTVSVSHPQIAGVARMLSPGQNVTLRGAVTGTTHHKLGSLCLSYSFNQGGNDFCFRDAIEILPQSWGPFGGTLGQIMSTVPTQGDSGAWVLTDDQPPNWAGVFFGEDGHRGFLIRASWVHDWANKTIGYNLTL